jgi:hypothetical protein
VFAPKRGNGAVTVSVRNGLCSAGYMAVESTTVAPVFQSASQWPEGTPLSTNLSKPVDLSLVDIVKSLIQNNLTQVAVHYRSSPRGCFDTGGCVRGVSAIPFLVAG